MFQLSANMCPQYIPLMLEMWKKLCRALQLSRERRRNTSEVEETWERKRQTAMLWVCLSQHFAMNGCWGFHGNNIAASLVGREIFCIFSWCIIRLFLLSIHAWTRPNASKKLLGRCGSSLSHLKIRSMTWCSLLCSDLSQNLFNNMFKKS